MRARLYRKDAAEPLCEAEVEIRSDAARGMLFEARLNEDASRLAVDLAGVVVFVTADGNELFFLRAGFRTRVRVLRAQLKDPPMDWIPDASASVGCPDFLCMVRSDDVEVAASSMSSDLDDFASRPGTTTEDKSCARCRAPLPQLRWLGVLEGYHCRGCRFLHVCGTLALSPWDRGDSISTISRFTGSKRRTDGAVFTSGSDLLGRA